MSLKDKLTKTGLEVKGVHGYSNDSLENTEKNFKIHYSEIEASSLSRVWKHYSDLERPVLVMTAFLSPKTTEYFENVQRNRNLANEVRKQKLGYFWAKGEWTDEKTGEKYIDDILFIAGNKHDNGKLKGLARKWMKEFDQKSVLFKDEGSVEGKEMLSDGTTKPLGKWHPKQIGDAFTQLRDGNKFSFASFYETRGWVEMMGVARDINEQDDSE